MSTQLIILLLFGFHGNVLISCQLITSAEQELLNENQLPVSWYYNSLIHQPEIEKENGVGGIIISPGELSLRQQQLNSENSIGDDFSSPTTTTSKSDLARYLSLILNGKWSMSGVEWNYYCSGRMPDMVKLMSGMDRFDFFYGGNPGHRATVMEIGNSLSSVSSSPLSIIRLAGCMRDDPTMNKSAWLRALLATIISNPTLSSLNMPSVLEIMPSMFIKSEAIIEATRPSRYRRQIINGNNHLGNGQCTVVNGLIGRDNGIENLLWYWREDVWLNSFHWYWHLTYPFMGGTPRQPRPDRRGELLYYSHHSICARYHSERLSVGLATVEPLELFPSGISALNLPYNPHLHDGNSGRRWTARGIGAVVMDVNVQTELSNEPMVVDLESRAQQLSFILGAIDAGVAITDSGLKIPLRNYNGIDILGDMIEASVYSINPNLYGYPGVHNDAHVAIGLVEDPIGELGLAPGVMADPSVAMRDPIFYQYHVQVDEIFERYKSTLIPYRPSDGEFKLGWDGVQVQGLAVITHGNPVINKLETFISEDGYELSRGLDFNRSTLPGEGPVNICVQHLDYKKFTYEIMIKRDPHLAPSGRATIRLFLAPRFNERGIRYNLDEQRRLFFALDRFPVFLTPGLNKILRHSTESTLTVPKKQSYINLQQDLNNETPFCGCGWPEHLLIPRGNSDGLAFDLFVMVTNGDEDAVPVAKNRNQAAGGCTPAPIFCGIVGENYPDSKPMGYPFDRKPYTIIDQDLGLKRLISSLEEYVLNVPNMGTVPVRIYHRELVGGLERGIVQEFIPLELGLESSQIHIETNSRKRLNCVPYKYRYLCLKGELLLEKKRR